MSRLSNLKISNFPRNSEDMDELLEALYPAVGTPIADSHDTVVRCNDMYCHECYGYDDGMADAQADANAEEDCLHGVVAGGVCITCAWDAHDKPGLDEPRKEAPVEDNCDYEHLWFTDALDEMCGHGVFELYRCKNCGRNKPEPPAAQPYDASFPNSPKRDIRRAKRSRRLKLSFYAARRSINTRRSISLRKIRAAELEELELPKLWQERYTSREGLNLAVYRALKAQSHAEDWESYADYLEGGEYLMDDIRYFWEFDDDSDDDTPQTDDYDNSDDDDLDAFLDDPYYRNNDMGF